MVRLRTQLPWEVRDDHVRLRDRAGPRRSTRARFRNALALEDYDTVIAEVRAAFAADPVAALADPTVNDWLGRRFRNIFIDEGPSIPRPSST